MNAPHDPLDTSRIQEILAPYEITADESLCVAIRVYIAMLAQWNCKVALTAMTDPVEVLRFHFGESLFAVSRMDICKGRLADIGTGPGFPGIPIRMVCPQLELLLVESNSKKAAFLSEVVRKLDLSGVSVIRKRMEEIGERETGKLDCVTARALGGYEDLLEWAKSRLSPRGRVIFWLGNEESAGISSIGGWNWEEPIKIPDSRSRFLLSARPK